MPEDPSTNKCNSSPENPIVTFVKTQGAITVSQFISLCVAHSTYGYYHHKAPFGREGDFITAPEISQMFGEMIGLWALNIWQQSGQPSRFTFCEMGPGRGTLMDDMLRTLKKLSPNFLEAAQIILIETSHNLRHQITEKLKIHDISLTFAYHIDDLPHQPIILIANELLDCLPIHQYLQGRSGWHERMITVDANGSLCFSLSPAIRSISFLEQGADHTFKHMHEGMIVETSPARIALIEEISRHILKLGGAALFIDYGSLDGGTGDTLQALSNHKYQDPLSNPGSHDLTSHVDFLSLKLQSIATGCTADCLTQGEFLEILGIKQRAAILMQEKSNHLQQKIAADLERLTASHTTYPHAMGELFKVLCITRP